MALTNTDNLAKPTVHLNGTSRHDLQRGYELAMLKTCDAINAVSDAYPNGRDYYPQGPGAITKAMAEHQSRYERLCAVRDELIKLYKSVTE